jgi:hypothetical protein
MSPLTLEWLAFSLYALAMMLHTLSRAGMSMSSPMTPWDSLQSYTKRFWPKLLPQWVLGVALFWLLWDNQAAGGLLKLPFLGDFPRVKLGLAIIFGWFSDSLLDQVLGLLHLEGKLPPPPPDGPDPKNP